MDQAHIDRTRRFDALFRAHSPDIVAYCGWRSDSATDAQDAVAEVFLTAWRRLDELPDGNAARLWLYATARRVMANQRRSSRRRIALHDRLLRERGGETVELFSAASGDGVVREALRRLRPRDREVLLLAEWEDLTPAEIGQVLGCLNVTARGRLHRARFRFRIAFEELRAEGNADASIEREDDHVDFAHLRHAQASQPAL
jgi:RNA polymerase sigma factor (sigma-70 family)